MTQAPAFDFARAPDLLRETALGIAVPLSLEGRISHAADLGCVRAAREVTSRGPPCRRRMSEWQA